MNASQDTAASEADGDIVAIARRYASDIVERHRPLVASVDGEHGLVVINHDGSTTVFPGLTRGDDSIKTRCTADVMSTLGCGDPDQLREELRVPLPEGDGSVFSRRSVLGHH